jgi:5-methylthioadenosine/S-adenosylhomocysteine deaminase
VPTTKLLIRDGQVLFPVEDEVRQVDVLVEDGRIAAIGPALQVEDSDVIDASGMVVSPGLVDTHRHSWQSQLRGIAADWSVPEYLAGIRETLGPQYQPEDVYAGTLLGCTEALYGGVTTVVDWAHIMNSPEHADAAVQALRDFGGRAVFAHGTPNDREIESWYVDSERPHPADIRRVRDQYFSSDDQLLTLAMAARGPQHTTAQVSVDDWRLARELGIRVTVHVGEGAWGQRHRPVQVLGDLGVPGPDTTFVHANTMSDAEFQIMADTGSSISISPEVEMHMGHGYPATGRALEFGLLPSLSVDVVVVIAGDMFSAMRCVLAAERARVNQQAIDQGVMVDRLTILSKDALTFATLGGARACGLEDKIGSIEVGKEADLILLKNSGFNLWPLNDAMASTALAAHPDNVDTVIVAGRVLKRDGVLTRVDGERVRQLAAESRDRILARAGVPARWRPANVDAWSEL